LIYYKNRNQKPNQQSNRQPDHEYLVFFGHYLGVHTLYAVYPSACAFERSIKFLLFRKYLQGGVGKKNPGGNPVTGE